MFTHKVMHFWQEYYINDAVFFPLHSLGRHMILICLIIGDVNFGHVISGGVC